MDDIEDFELGLDDVDDEDEAEAERKKIERQIDEDLEILNGFSDDEDPALSSDEDSDDSDYHSKSSDEDHDHCLHSQSEVSAEQSSIKKSSIDEALNLLNEFSDDEDPPVSSDEDSDDSDHHSKSSDEEHDHSLHSQSEVSAVQSSIKVSVEYSEFNNSNTDGSRISDVNHPNDSFVDYSRHSDVDCSRNCDVDYPDCDASHSRKVEEDHIDISNISHSDALDKNQSNTFPGDQTENEINYKNSTQPKLYVVIQSSTVPSFPKSDAFESEIKNHDQHNYGDISRRMPELQFEYQELQTEFKKLQFLFEIRGKELQQTKIKEIRAHEEVKSLTLKFAQLEGIKNILLSSFQESQVKISDLTHENNELKGRLSALEIQFSAEKEAKENIQAKLETAEITIQSLEQQYKGFIQVDNALRLQKQNENVIRDLKLRHQKEVLKYKENIDRLEENLNEKESLSKESKSSEIQMLKEEYNSAKSAWEKEKIVHLKREHVLGNKLLTALEEEKKLLEKCKKYKKFIRSIEKKHAEETGKLRKENQELKESVDAKEKELRLIKTQFVSFRRNTAYQMN